MDFNLNFQLFENSIKFIEYSSNLLFILIIPQNDEKINFIYYIYLDFQIELSNS